MNNDSKYINSIQKTTINILSIHGLESWSVKQVAKDSALSVSDIFLHFSGENEILTSSLKICILKMTDFVFTNLEFYGSLRNGLESIWLNYLRFRQTYPHEENVIQLFLKTPSKFYHTQLKSELTSGLKPLTAFINLHCYSISGASSLIIFSYLVKSTKAISAKSDYLEDAGRDKSMAQFNVLFWPDFLKILELPFFNNV